jgi:hypothetical protein
MTDLDMVGGAGNRRAEIVAASVDCLEAQRGDAGAVPRMMGLSWATGWLGYLAHLRMLAEEPLEQVVANADGEMGSRP